MLTFSDAMFYLILINIFKTLYNSDSDEDLGHKLLVTAVIYLVIVFVQSQYFPAPYGKFNEQCSISVFERIRQVASLIN